MAETATYISTGLLQMYVDRLCLCQTCQVDAFSASVSKSWSTS